MDRRERMQDLMVAVRAAMRGMRADVWTALPGILQSYDSGKLTCTVQPAIQAQIRDSKTGTWTNQTLPVLVDCPVDFPGGGGYTLTFPLAKGDEGIVVFSARCIDSWWQSGGVQPQAEFRMHDLSDGMFIPGIRSQRRKLNPAPPANKTQLRSDDGVQTVELDATGKKITMTSGTTILQLDDTPHRVNVTAVGGLWVNGVQVTVP